MDKESVTRKAPDLVRGDWILIADDTPAEVLLAVPSADGSGPFVYLTYRYTGGAIESIEATVDRWFELASQERLAALRKQAERVGQIANIRRLADWLESNPDVPMPYAISATEHWSDTRIGDPDVTSAMATIRNLSQMFGIKLDEHLDDRTRFIVPFGRASYELVVWHRDGRPADADADGQAFLDAMHKSIEEVRKANADPTGLAYSRADDEPEGDVTQHLGHRIEPHVGAVTEQGLVDETPAPAQHYSEHGTWTSCDQLIGGSGFPADEGWTNMGGHVTCKPCLDAMPQAV